MRSKAIVQVASLAALLLGLAAGPASASDGRLLTFSSPSHNIGCAMDRGFARCDIARRTWSPPPKPRRCMLDWGQGLVVSTRGKATFVCAGDTTLNPKGRVLGFGRTLRAGRFACTSRTSGMTCRNGRSGQGFFVSRASYRAF